MLSLVGWISGASATGVVVVCTILGLLVIRKYTESQNKLLLFIGLTIFFMGLTWLGNVVDFFTIIWTKRNLDNSFGLIGILSMFWLPFAIICAIYVGAELQIPEHK